MSSVAARPVWNLGRWALIILAILGVAVSIAMWGGLKQEADTFRLRATATFVVDGVERSGSSVQEYRLVWNYQPQIGNDGAWRLLARGEGIKVDVPGEEPIYVQLTAGTVFSNCGTPSRGQDAIRDSLLTFKRCEADKVLPTAIRYVGEDADVLAVHGIGKDWNGYEFRSLVYERTSEPVTDGVMPTLQSDSRGLIYVPFGTGRQTLGNLSFKHEDFR